MDRPIVLIVDDEPLISGMVEVTFEDVGFEVRTVMDAAEAAQQIGNLGSRLSALLLIYSLARDPTGGPSPSRPGRSYPCCPLST